jgi:hypothetical protein
MIRLEAAAIVTHPLTFGTHTPSDDSWLIGGAGTCIFHYFLNYIKMALKLVKNVTQNGVAEIRNLRKT